VKIPYLRWWIAVLLFSATVINYVDRQTLSILAPVLSRELHLSTTEYANIVSAFLYAYTVMYLVSGVLVDRWGTRASLGTVMAWWSVSNMLHAFARTAMGLAGFRVLLGIGEPGNFMAASKAASEWYPAKERAVLNGVVQAGASVGAIVAAPVIVWLYRGWGWRTAFVATGSLGFVWLMGWYWLYRLPERNPLITDQERQLILESRPTGSGEKMRWVDLLGFRETWGLFFSRFLSDPVWWFYLFWLPKYLSDQRGFSMDQIGALAWLPYLTADLGSISGGVFSGWLVKRGWSPLAARRTGMWPFALVMPISVAIPFVESSSAALAIISVITFAHMAWKTNQMTVTNDIYPVRVVGSVSGLTAFGNGLGGAMFTWLTGLVVTKFSYTAVFVVMGFLHPLAYVVFRALVKGPVAATPQAN
jgi:ACS family hexuronate transporter-like MFS transporter